MRLLLATIFLSSTICFAQKHYKFDYLLEYELTHYKDSIKIKNRPFRDSDITTKKYYLTNSSDNSYVAVLTELDSLNYRIVFKDEKGIFSDVTFLKHDVDKAEFLKIDCQYVAKYGNPYKYQTKNYAFFKLKDTIINEENYSKYKLESIKPKKVKKKKIGTSIYVIDKKTSFHLPVFNFSTAYEEWKAEGGFPNGIFAEKYFIDYYGSLDSKERLLNYSKIDKKIVIDSECDHTKDQE